MSNIVQATGIDLGWTIDTVKPSVNDNNLILDHDMASDGRFGIAYSSNLNDGVYFIERSSPNHVWSSSELVQPTGNAMRAFAYTPSGMGSILSRDQYNSDDLILSTDLGAGWVDEIIENNPNGLWYRNALSYDQEGNPLISYGINVGKGKNATNALTLTRWNPVTQVWESEVLDTANAFLYVSVAVGPNGPAIACFAREESSSGEYTFDLRYVEHDGEQWTISSLGDWGRDVVIDVNPVTGASAIACRDGNKVVHFLSQRADGMWDQEALSVTGYLRDLKFSQAGKPCLLVVDQTPTSSADRTLLWKTSDTWQKERILPVPSVGSSSMGGSLVMTPSGVPTVAFTLGSNPTIVFAERHAPID